MDRPRRRQSTNDGEQVEGDPAATRLPGHGGRTLRSHTRELRSLTTSGRTVPPDHESEVPSLRVADRSDDKATGPHHGNSLNERKLAPPSESSGSEFEQDWSSVEQLEHAAEDLSDSDAEDPEEAPTSRRNKDQDKNRPERHPDAPSTSKLQMKIQQHARKGYELNSMGVRKGKVEYRDGHLYYLNKGDFIPAVYHEQIRGFLLEFADNQPGKYLEEPLAGADPLDRTAYKAGHSSWVLRDRNRRPEALFQFEQDPHKEPGVEPETWFFGDRVVLSTDNLPLRQFDELPLTISGQCEGMRSK